MASTAVLKTLCHRLGVKELDVELVEQLTEPSSSSLRALSPHSNWAVRAATLSLAATQFDDSLATEDVEFALMHNLDHENSRVRAETLPLLSLLAKRDFSLAWHNLGPKLLAIAQSAMQLDEETRGIEAELQGARETKQEFGSEDDIEYGDLYKDMAWEIDLYRTKRYSVLSLRTGGDGDVNVNGNGSVRSSRLSSSGWSARRRLDSGQVVLMVHETVGWKSLESSLRGLCELLRQNNKQQQQNVPQDGAVQAITKQALRHSNRYVRLVGFELLDASLTSCPPAADMAKWLVRGLCDHVNEVRLRAALACVTLLTKGPRGGDDAVDKLGPALFLNRHYSQVGVREPSLAAWRASGLDKAQVEANLSAYVDFFIDQSQRSKDEFAREAACVAMGELVCRVMAGNDTAKQRIADAVRARLADGSWSVQAAACQAAGELAGAAEEGGGDADVLLAPLVDPLLSCASDMIWSVRDEAAVTLARISRRGTSSEAASSIRRACRDMMLRHTPHHHHHHHDHAAQEDQVMFSCCSSEIQDKSLLKKHDFQYIDGGLRLFRELVLAGTADGGCAALLDDFAEFVDQRNAHRHDVVEETLWKLLVPLAPAVGKREFKSKLLDRLLPGLCRALEHPCFSAAYAASLACQFLAGWLGENIFRARVEALSPDLWDLVQRNPPDVFDSPVVSFRG